MLALVKGLTITLLCAISLIAAIYQSWSGEPPAGKLGCLCRVEVLCCLLHSWRANRPSW